jgi:lipoyl(octanoyl) transferase
MSGEILVVRCGTLPYMEAWDLQRELEGRRQREEIGDVLLLLEHPPVYTRGRRSTPEELPMGVAWYEAQGIEVVETDRGGLVTYHGPGQLVAYPIVDLKGYGDDIHAFVRGLERTIIESLGGHGVPAQTIKDLTGVWTHGRRDEKTNPSARRDEKSFSLGQIGPSATEIGLTGPSARKIASIGLHVSRGVTTHGLAVNVNNDLQPFEWVVPCGIEGVSMSSLARELGAEQDFDAFAETLVGSYARVFDRKPVARDSVAV